MLILIPVNGTTKSGRGWITQVSINEDLGDISKQMLDNLEQLEYERSQLL